VYFQHGRVSTSIFLMCDCDTDRASFATKLDCKERKSVEVRKKTESTVLEAASKRALNWASGKESLSADLHRAKVEAGVAQESYKAQDHMRKSVSKVVEEDPSIYGS